MKRVLSILLSLFVANVLLAQPDDILVEGRIYEDKLLLRNVKVTVLIGDNTFKSYKSEEGDFLFHLP
jgi:hypothetical protein